MSNVKWLSIGSAFSRGANREAAPAERPHGVASEKAVTSHQPAPSFSMASLGSKRLILERPSPSDYALEPRESEPAEADSKALKRTADSAFSISPPYLVKRKLVPSPKEIEETGEKENCMETFCVHGCLRSNGHPGLCLTDGGVAPPNAKKQHAAAKRWAQRGDDWMWETTATPTSTKVLQL